MYKKYFAWSFDDGLEQDKRIIPILKRYGMRATFHLSSGLFGVKAYEQRIGNLGIESIPKNFNPNKRHILPHVPHFSIPEDEVCQVYEGFEIASHTCMHKNLALSPESVRRSEILNDVKALSEKFGKPVTGFAYPYGMGASKCSGILKEAGIQYARTASAAKDFFFPRDPLQLPMTGWHIKKNTFETLEKFFEAEPVDDDLFFLMFGHGYEFDFGTEDSSWSKLERICEMVARRDDITFCTIQEAFDAHNGK